MYKSIFISIVFIALIACGGTSDFKQDLGNNYFYFSESKDKKVIMYSLPKRGDSIIISSTVTYCEFNDAFIVARQKNNLDEYKCDVCVDLRRIADAFKFVDSNGIDSVSSIYRNLYTKNINDSNFYRSINEKTSLQNTEQDQQILNKITDSLFDNDIKYSHFKDGEINYWIIDKRNNKAYGPLKNEEYNILKNRLNVPGNLSIKDKN